MSKKSNLQEILKLCIILLLLSACSRTENTMSQTLASAEDDVANGGRGLAKLNPSPRKAVEVTLKIHNAPGPFAVVEGGAQYDVTNEDQCGHIEPATGTGSRITSQENVVLRKVSDDEYRGTVYLDLMQDEDYYGRGVCHWELTGASAMLKATGAEGETRFLSFIKSDSLLEGGALTRYYAEMDYPRAETMSDYPSSGREDPNEYRPELRDTLFHITLGASEVK